MKFEIQRESKWNSVKSEIESTYWLMVDGHYVELYANLEHALERFEVLKAKYRHPEKVVIDMFEVDAEIPVEPITVTIKQEVVND